MTTTVYDFCYDKEGRPTRESIHMHTALMWSLRSQDPRRQVGCIITTRDLKQVLSIGYNGPAKGLPPEFIRDTPGDSGCLHAEENALLKLKHAGRMSLFTTDMPCEYCAQRIVQAEGIEEVFWLRPYRDKKAISIFRQCGINDYQIFLPVKS